MVKYKLFGSGKNEKVLLICESGISTNLLARSAKPFVELYNADVELIPTDIDNASEYLDEGVQLVLVAPQATYLDKELSLFGEGIPVKTIPDEIYGWANGEKLIKFIMAQLSPIEAA